MYLLYLDASGSANPKDINTKHYVYLGLSMQEQDWSDLNADLDALKSRYRFPGEDFELHVKQFAVSMREQDKTPDFEKMGYEDRRTVVRELREKALAAEKSAEKREEMRKRFKGTDPFIHLTRAQRSQLLEDAVALAGSFDNIKLFADAVSKSHPGVTGGTVDPVIETFTQAITRFDTFLDKIAMKAQERDRRARIDHGLLILDQDSSTESVIHQKFRHFRQHGHPFGKLRHVIDVPFFAPSDQVSGLQLADVCAYVLRRYLDTGAVMGSHEERQFLTIFRLFDRDPRGRLHGLRHYVPARVCKCLICAERDHGPVQ